MYTLVYKKINTIRAIKTALLAVIITTMLPPQLSLADTVTVISPQTTVTQQAPSGSSQVTNNLQQSAEENAAVEAIKPLEIKPDSLAAQQMPTLQQLSTANQELLTKNAYLQRQINDLETQVNVLINERSGQLFLYGVLTVIFSFIAGILATLLFKKKRDDRW